MQKFLIILRECIELIEILDLECMLLSSRTFLGKQVTP